MSGTAASASAWHWPEYLMEAALLGLFMISACVFTVLLEFPGSPVRQAVPDPAIRRFLIGIAMGTTAIALIYSPWGKQSGAHFNPSTTLTFWWLGKVRSRDAVWYIVAQFVGSAAGVMIAHAFLGPRLADPTTRFAATLPGAAGLLAAMALRLRGLDVTVFGRTAKPYLNSDLIEALGARYESTVTLPILEGAKKYGPFDLIFEATGASPVVFESMQALGKNGVLVLSSVTGGDKKIEIPADRINLEFVLGNKVMVGTVNANREYFEMGVKDPAQSEAQYPGWLDRLLTHPVKGLENWKLVLDTLTTAKGAIKVYCEVARE